MELSSNKVTLSLKDLFQPHPVVTRRRALGSVTPKPQVKSFAPWKDAVQLRGITIIPEPGERSSWLVGE